MAGYVVLWKMTEKARADIKAFAEGLKQREQLLHASGGRRVGLWLTLGEYDGLSILDVPDDLTMAKLSLQVAQDGLTVTHTMRALSQDEFAQIVGTM